MEQSNTGIFEKIIDYLFSNGFWAGVMFLLLFSILFGLYKFANNTPKIKEAIAFWISNKAYKINIDKLKKHHIFMQQLLMKNKAYSITFKNEPLKSKIFQVFFATKLSVDMKKIREFVNNDFTKITKSELHILMTNLIEDMRSSYDNEIKNNLLKLCEHELLLLVGDSLKSSDKIECTEKIFNHIMYSEKGYEEFRNYRIENLLSDLELIRESPIYDNNNERVYHFLDILNSSINRAILRAGKIFEDFNGQIDAIFNSFLKEYVK